MSLDVALTAVRPTDVFDYNENKNLPTSVLVQIAMLIEENDDE